MGIIAAQTMFISPFSQYLFSQGIELTRARGGGIVGLTYLSPSSPRSDTTNTITEELDLDLEQCGLEALEPRFTISGIKGNIITRLNQQNAVLTFMDLIEKIPPKGQKTKEEYFAALYKNKVFPKLTHLDLGV